tara:strand:+ start:841 stop:1080 length:240 start_codon:yes stop_codon:yes gene_type:complete
MKISNKLDMAKCWDILLEIGMLYLPVASMVCGLSLAGLSLYRIIKNPTVLIILIFGAFFICGISVFILVILIVLDTRRN